MRRPNPLQWVYYAYGGRLPDDYRDWVLHDATTRTWLLRYASRIVVQALPWLVAGFLLLTWLTPVPVLPTLGALGLGLLLSLYFTVTSADELSEARLTQHGFPPGTGKESRRRDTGSSWGRWRKS
ncbi:DUF5313 family protein [Actinokineospora xionganensis]|uniref:DUF5313 family protein n=1 Tax=Actinokineospora xionganensis TaxID=2684470 RepID=A0ABR7L5S8_9PSEU|nr:DUF5313 family protein [Actinokineospora xionganensis]MBC6448035.1 DUF5313 family protein [Actinokineospora xionganensis]